jgi:hypothetical protein
MFKSFAKGTFKTPTQFLNKNVWHSVNDFCTSLLSFNAGCWDQILGSLKLPMVGVYYAQGGFEDEYLAKLSAFQVDLMSFSSPLKD